MRTLEMMLVCGFLYCSFLYSVVDAYMSGAPRDVCLSMHTAHNGIAHQLIDNPFIITMAKQSYKPSEGIDLTLSSRDARPFKGFMIVAHRTSGDQEKAIGTMVKYPTNKAQAVGCTFADNTLRVLTHKNNETVTEVTFTWKAPAQNEGNITFRYMVVESFESFWFGANSEILVGSAPDDVKTATQTVPTGKVSPIDWASCGQTSGCFLHPRLCTGSDCKAAFTYRQGREYFVFELFTSGHQYISVGFSDDKKMTDDQAHTCVAADDQLSIQSGYNPYQYLTRIYNDGKLTNMTVWTEDGRTACRFIRPRKMVVPYETGNRTFDLDQAYYLMLAWGEVYPTTMIPHEHQELPVVSESKVFLGDIDVIRGSSLPVLIQIHGILMIISWILLAGITTVIPRHYKDMMADRLICGIKPWFQIHRACATLLWLSTSASFIVIFVHVQGLSQSVRNHAICGIALMVGCTLQALMGIARPGTDSKFRPYFNVGHFLLGKACHGLAAACVVLVFLGKIFTSEQRQFGLIVTSVWIVWQILAELLLEWRMYSKQRETSKKYEMENETTKDGCLSCTDMGLLLFYVTSLLALLAAAVCSIILF